MMIDGLQPKNNSASSRSLLHSLSVAVAMVLAGCMSADDQLQQLDEEYKALSRVYKQFVSQLPDDIIPDSIRVKVEDARYTLRFVERGSADYYKNLEILDHPQEIINNFCPPCGLIKDLMDRNKAEQRLILIGKYEE